ncbi:hypothetical protein [Streptomyces sp. TRM49041]|uniref:hypothetical protein n=1 Tax=Streptomyces sp. TRM49041 TaxID=2603216 RepID=UPI0021CCB9C0|nr:hypothetical protein [Streptomyces sp. TRM49041]
MVTDPADGDTDGAPPVARAAFGRLRAVADAVLYEGYLLYPYRRSSPKNRVRWQFGVLTPREWAEAGGPVPPGVSGSVDSWYQQTECLLRAGPTASVHVQVRYLQLQRKQVERRGTDGDWRPVEETESAGTVHLTFDEAVPRETDLVAPLAALLGDGRSFSLGRTGGEETEPLGDGHGRVVRRRWPVEAVALVQAERLPGEGGLHRLRVRTENTGRSPGGGTASRDEALRGALIATHTLIGGDGLEFVSSADPPEDCETHARDCRNLHTFPVLAGAPGSGAAVLSSPIILSDHPEVAPESPGDLHDAAEIDEILTLRTLLLTDEEKREARATDRRAAEILDRVESMPPEIFARLHGTVRSLDPRPEPERLVMPERLVTPSPAAPGAETGAAPGPARGTAPWWQEGGDDGLCPTTDSVLVDGVPVASGARVLLRPRGRGADAHDMFLTGRTAQVAAVFHDVDGSVHVAVTLDDDPAAELNSWYGRFFYFRPDELQPVDADREKERCDGRSRSAEA